MTDRFGEVTPLIGIERLDKMDLWDRVAAEDAERSVDEDEVMRVADQEYERLAEKFGLRKTVVGIAIDRKSNFLLVKSAKAPVETWYFPQGGVEAGETLVEAIMREFKEELGIAKSDLRIVESDFPFYKDYQIFGRGERGDLVGKFYLFYLMRFTGLKKNIILNRDEINARRFCPPGEVLEYLSRSEGGNPKKASDSKVEISKGAFEGALDTLSLDLEIYA